MSEKHYLDTVIEKGIIFLLVFTPLAIGTVQAWSAAIMEIAAFLVLAAWLLRSQPFGEGALCTPKFLYPAAALFGLVVFQLVPLPPRLLSLLSPSTAAMYRQFAHADGERWWTISIHPDATMEGLYRLLAYAAVFIVISNHVRTRDQLRSIVRTILVMGCVLAVFAVAQKMTWNGRLFWVYPLDESFRPMGPYINRNHFAGYMEMAIPLGAGLLLSRLSRLRVPGRISLAGAASVVADSEAFYPVLGISLAILAMSAGLFLSLSRGGIIGFAAAMLCFLFMARTKRSLRKRSLVVAVIGAGIVLSVLLAAWGRIEDRFEELGLEGRLKRLDIWSDSVGVIATHPLWGTGLGTFGDAYLRHQTTSPGLTFDHAHNDYLEILTDMGIVGFAVCAAMAWIFWSFVVRAWNARRSRFVTGIAAGGTASCAAIAVHSLVDFNMHIPANALLATVIAAVSYAAVVNVNGETDA